jgi:hypothetical protein
MRNSVVLNEIFEDEMCAIVFQVEYVINVPIQITVDNLNSKNKVFENCFCCFEPYYRV